MYKEYALNELNDCCITLFTTPIPPVPLAACLWRSLLVALIEERRHIEPQADMELDLVMADLMELLVFHGIRNTHWLRDLLQLDVMKLRTVDQESLEKLATWAWPSRPAVLAERASWFSAPELHGIRAESMVTRGEIVDGQSRG
jgi:hypothetical protein